MAIVQEDRMIVPRAVSIVMLLLCSSPLVAQPREFQLRISRVTGDKIPRFILPDGSRAAHPSCTTGLLRVFNKYGSLVLHLSTLEPDNIGNIPKGTYSAHLVYHHLDQWRIQLDDVLGRTAIQIHVGNFPRDTTGCVLVGMGHGPDRMKYPTGEEWCTLRDSQGAYRALKKAFYGSDSPTATPNVTISVTIE